MYNVQEYSVFYNNAVYSMFYSHMENTCMAALVHRTSLTPPRFIESERSCFCV